MMLRYETEWRVLDYEALWRDVEADYGGLFSDWFRENRIGRLRGWYAARSDDSQTRTNTLKAVASRAHRDYRHYVESWRDYRSIVIDRLRGWYSTVRTGAHTRQNRAIFSRKKDASKDGIET